MGSYESARSAVDQLAKEESVVCAVESVDLLRDVDDLVGEAKEAATNLCGIE